jgi:NYN domain
MVTSFSFVAMPALASTTSPKKSDPIYSYQDVTWLTALIMVGRKVADKMIMVDAMQFAFQHPEGAALCFITGDADYAYLLATLQRPQWRTIVISRGTMQSMLHVNCDMKMRRETDILQPIYGNPISETKPSVQDENAPVNAWDTPFRPLSVDEGWKDDVELLRSVLKQHNQVGVLTPLKSLIGNVLRNTNHARFPQRSTIKKFLARAVEEGMVVENGDGSMKTLSLPMHAGHPATVPSLTLSRKLPASFEGFPSKVVETSFSAPFVVLLRKMHCPGGANPPSKAFVQASPEWLFYKFATHAAALEAVCLHPWLQQGTFVDLRQIAPSALAPHDTPVSSSSRAGLVCPICKILVPQDTVIYSGPGPQGYFCSVECQEWIHQDANALQGGVNKVVATLEFLAGFDDLYAKLTMLVKLVHQRYPADCSSRKVAKLWILEAEKSEKVVVYRVLKHKFVALPNHFPESIDNNARIASMDTKEAEQYVYTLLWDNHGACMDRKIINKLLKENFPSMATPWCRNQVFVNGKLNSRFCTAKGPHNQLVGLNYEDAEAALEASYPMSSRIPEGSSIEQEVDLSATQDEIGFQDSNGGSDCSDEEIDLSLLVRSKA